MAGRGTTPKPASTRARRNKEPTPLRLLPFEGIEKQPLPDDLLAEGEAWHPATIRWWKRWCDSGLSDTWTAVDWSFLEETVVLHHEYMKKRTFTLGSELRLREGKMGATPEDRARLRIVFESADEAEDKGQRRRAAAGSKQPTAKKDPRSILSAVS